MQNSGLSGHSTVSPPPAKELAYAEKPSQYFAGARTDFVGDLPDNPDAVILEIGCGNGGTGRLAIKKGKCARYCGVELDVRAASAAAEILHEVVCGDIETLELPWPNCLWCKS